MRTILSDVEDILNKYNNIGIMISGGLDSALLAYLLHDIKYKQNRTTKLNFFVVPKPDGSVMHATNVINYLDMHFNQSASELHIVGNPEGLHHSKMLTSGLIRAIKDFDCEVFLTAVTTNPEQATPPEQLLNYEYGKFLEPDGTPYNGPVRVKANHPRVIDAFWDYTKQDTVKIIKDMNLTELVKITHTCTGSKTIRCNKCWQCCERAWAFAKNDFIDKGTM
jgi:hypothetical protein